MNNKCYIIMNKLLASLQLITHSYIFTVKCNQLAHCSDLRTTGHIDLDDPLEAAEGIV